MSKVVNTDIVEPGHPSDALPRPLNANEMSVAAFRGQNVEAALLAWQLGKRTKRGRPERYGLGPGLAVGQEQATAFEVNPFPPKREDLREAATREDQKPT